MNAFNKLVDLGIAVVQSALSVFAYVQLLLFMLLIVAIFTTAIEPLL